MMSAFDVRTVEDADRSAIAALSIRQDQAGFVAPNEISLADADKETGAYPFCIVAEGRIVGFLLAEDMADSTQFEPGDAYLWRLMITADQQRRGYGRRAMTWFHDWASARGKTRLVLTVRDDNRGGLSFYSAVGYRPTGRVRDGKIEYARNL